jgi:hypothetical protein
MRTSIRKAGSLALLAGFGLTAMAQGIQPDLQYYRLPGYDGLNVFETGKKNEVVYDGFKVRLGGDFALQYQFLNHSADVNEMYSLVRIGNSVNLPTANLNIDAQLADGLRVHLRTYLSSRHHNESWVKGGYIQIDRLDFIKEDFLGGLMDIMSVKAGVDNFSYGDAVFRRTDNAMAIYNPFVGNYLMDNNTVEPFLELQFFPGDFIAIGGIGTGILNPSVIRSADPLDPTNADEYDHISPSFWAKIGWDSQVNQDLRVRVTGSIYSTSDWGQGYRLYAGDRAGARYYKVFDYIDMTGANPSTSTNDFSGRVNPNLRQLTAFQINPFIKFQGLEFFGIFEVASGYASGAMPKAGSENETDNWEKGSYTQLGAEVLYRFGSWEQFYVAGRYNSVSGDDSWKSSVPNSTAPDTKTVNRLNFGGGWFMTKNTLVKLEYVTQTYNEFWTSSANNLKNGNFSGVMLEAVICF